MPLLETRDLQKNFGGVHVARNINLRDRRRARFTA